ncbi:hypothetical protein [Amycolatopsis circi]|uniref:hypothetical protein n=1 Tax=Amycolatopsis circi TaxID=871959 RepID=UPI000E22678E|nr:hypothetical protein [Amycolatopsis circi]
MEIDIPALDFTRLKTPDEATARRQIYELTHHNGSPLIPAETYHAEDSSGSIRLTVNRDAHLTDAHIDTRWNQRIPIGQFAEVLFRTYLTALQRVALVEAERPRPEAEPQRPPQDNETVREPLNIEETVERASYELEKINERVDRIEQSGGQVRPVEERQFSSPHGSLALVTRNGQPIGIAGATDRLEQLAPVQLAREIEKLFETAGVGLPSNDFQPPREPPARRPGPQDSDDDYFDNFNIEG